jgi:ubiquinone biosynthesis protein
MLDGLFAITRDFDMQTQPHLLLLQKTMVMVEGIATQLDPDINMWDTAAPFVRAWIRDELGPEAAIAEALRENAATLRRLPDLIRRVEDSFPAKGGAPESPPLPEIALMWNRRGNRAGPGWISTIATHVLAAGIGAAIFVLGLASGWWG